MDRERFEFSSLYRSRPVDCLDATTLVRPNFLTFEPNVSMAPLYDGHDYYKRMFELQEKLRKRQVYIVTRTLFTRLRDFDAYHFLPKLFLSINFYTLTTQHKHDFLLASSDFHRLPSITMMLRIVAARRREYGWRSDSACSCESLVTGEFSISSRFGEILFLYTFAHVYKKFFKLKLDAM